MAATKKQSNRRGTAKTTSGRKNTRKKQTRKQVKKQGVTSGFHRDHFADNSGGFDHIDHQ